MLRLQREEEKSNSEISFMDISQVQVSFNILVSSQKSRRQDVSDGMLSRLQEGI